MPTTAEQQLALELINRARSNPAAEFDALISNGVAVQANVEAALNFFDVDLDLFLEQLQDYDSVPPLAFNDALASSALTHTQLMIDNDSQSHNLPGEIGLLARVVDAGYTNVASVGESIFAFSQDVEYAHAAFYIDWGFGPGGIQDPAGHRNSILSATFTEVGIAWVEETDPSTSVGPFLTTQHFGTTFNYEAQALGVVFSDHDGDDFYDIGEGVEGVTITFDGTDETYVTQSWASGGYQIALPDGVYTVTFSGAGLAGDITSMVTLNGENVKIDAQFDDIVAAAPAPFGTDDADDLIGSANNDEINAGLGNDSVQAGDGDDDVRGGGGDDIITGGAGDDVLRGGQGVDLIFGGDGGDIIRSQRHGDTVYGGDGDDNIKGGGGNDVLYGEDGNDYLKGGTRVDELYGGAGEDELIGNSFDDILDGGAGNDHLLAGGDNDRLTGGTGDDWLKGGSGNDIFAFDIDHGMDVIIDFDAEVDRIEISTALANGLTAEAIASQGVAQANGNLVINFADDDQIELRNFNDISALSDAIDIV